MANRPEFQRHVDADGRKLYRKGLRRQVRATKRMEADVRNSVSAPDKRRSFWRERGFSRQSEAARIVRGAVAEGTVISRTIIPDVA